MIRVFLTLKRLARLQADCAQPDHPGRGEALLRHSGRSEAKSADPGLQARAVVLDPGSARRAGRFLSALAVILAALPGAAAADPLILPVSPACVSSPFGPRVLPDRPLAGTFHYGIDLPAPEGAPVRAVAPGQVIRVQRHGPGGLEMLIQHDGFVGVYSHLGMVAPLIAEGRRTVFGGEKIGTVGHTGLTYGMHLYFGMFVNGRPADPAPFLQVPLCSSGRSAGGTRTADGKLLPSRTYPGSSHRVMGIILPATSHHPAEVKLSRAPQ